MNETFEKLCKKYSLSENARLEFKSLFEKEIINVFNRKSVEIEEESNEEESNNGKKSILKKIAKTSTNSDNICIGKKADGKPCTFKAKPESDYCGRHNPDKKEDKTTKSGSKPRVKKDTKHECHAIIPKTGKKCIQPGSVKPEGSDFHYCKRHSEVWINFEKEPDEELVPSEEEAEEVEVEVEED
jgi:hypothetical protein